MANPENSTDELTKMVQGVQDTIGLENVANGIFNLATGDNKKDDNKEAAESQSKTADSNSDPSSTPTPKPEAKADNDDDKDKAQDDWKGQVDQLTKMVESVQDIIGLENVAKTLFNLAKGDNKTADNKEESESNTANSSPDMETPEESGLDSTDPDMDMSEDLDASGLDMDMPEGLDASGPDMGMPEGLDAAPDLQGFTGDSTPTDPLQATSGPDSFSDFGQVADAQNMDPSALAEVAAENPEVAAEVATQVAPLVA